MAFSMLLGQNGLTPERIETKADVTLDKVGDGFEITTIDLTMKAKIPGATQEQFTTIANQAKEGCPVSKVLKGAKINLNATLEG